MIPINNRLLLKLIFSLALLFLFDKTIYSQSVIEGIVFKYGAEEPVPYANVYINNSSEGILTNERGYFRFYTNQSGTLELIVSHVGYQSELKLIEVEENLSNFYSFELKESKMSLDEVIVTSNKDKDWEKSYRRFQKYFLGPKKHIIIENPYVIDFTTDALGNLYAKASEPLKVINNHLGYEINYELIFFKLNKKLQPSYKGYARYESLVNGERAEEWEINRLSDYYGSLMHFLRTLTNNNSKEEGFYFYGANKLENTQEDLSDNLSVTNILLKGNNRYSLTSSFRYLKVDFQNDFEFFGGYSKIGQAFWLEFKEKMVLFNPNGSLMEPFKVIQHGSLAEKLFFNELPTDFIPNQKKLKLE